MSEAFQVVEGLLNIKIKFLYTFRLLSGVSYLLLFLSYLLGIFFNKFMKYSIHLFSYQYLAFEISAFALQL